VNEEKEKVISLEASKAEASGVRIIALNKYYHYYPFNVRSKKDFHAVKNIYLEI